MVLFCKSLPKYESEIRQIVNSYNFAKKQRTQLINKLHSIFNMNGVPEVKKSDLEKNESRVFIIAERLDDLACLDATMVEELITSVELKIEKYIDIMRNFILLYIFFSFRYCQERTNKNTG